MYDIDLSSLWQSADQVGFEKEDCFGIVLACEYSFGPRVTSLSLRSGNFLVLLQRLGPSKFRTCKCYFFLPLPSLCLRMVAFLLIYLSTRIAYLPKRLACLSTRSFIDSLICRLAYFSLAYLSKLRPLAYLSTRLSEYHVSQGSWR